MITSIVLFILLLLFVSNFFEEFTSQITGKSIESPKETVRVDLFAMSMCTPCVNFEPTISEVVKLLEDYVRFRVYYVASESDGAFRSKHGQKEVDEDIRQVCVYEYYPDRFFDYILCVGQNYRNPEDVWEECAKNSEIDVEIIRECWQREEGKLLFSENIKKREYLRISKSPVLLINKKNYTGKRTPEALKDWICDEFKNPPEECETDLSRKGITGAIVGIPSEGFCEIE
jgi:predicted DsbA family dithiol-disulfide isomerase